MNQSTIIKIAAAVVVLIVLTTALIFLTKSRTPHRTVFTIDTTDQPRQGKSEAKVHIVAFEDLKCMACKIFNTTVLPQLKKDYIDTGIANYTVINVAFIPGSIPAANAARCLYKENPDWFFTFVDYIYQNQPPENQDWATIPKLVEFAQVIPGVDTEKLSQCIYESPYTEFIQNNFKQASKLQGATVATPAIYINGRFVDPPTLLNLKKAIDEEK